MDVGVDGRLNEYTTFTAKVTNDDKATVSLKHKHNDNFDITMSNEFSFGKEDNFDWYTSLNPSFTVNVSKWSMFI